MISNVIKPPAAGDSSPSQGLIFTALDDCKIEQIALVRVFEIALTLISRASWLSASERPVPIGAVNWAE